MINQQHAIWHFTKQGHGDVLVLLHGWSFDKNVWSYQIDEFTREFSLVTVDLPGHGKSAYAADIDIVNDLYQLVCSLRRQKISIIGHSFGGFLALQFAAQYAELVEKLVVVGAPAKFVCSDDYPHGLTLEQIAQLRGFLDKEYPKILLVFMRWLFTTHERTQPQFKEIWKRLHERDHWPDREALSWILSLIEKADTREELHRITAHTLIINGSHDPICPKEGASYLKKHLDNSELELFNNCGHLPFMTEYVDFNRLVKNFLLEKYKHI